MNETRRSGELIAVIGAEARLQSALSMEFPGCMVFDGKARFYADLSIRENVQQLRTVMKEADRELLEALLTHSGLTKQQGWTRPFRKDMTGQKRLFGILEAMLTQPDTLLAFDLLAGMDAKQREAFAKMADCYRGRGRRLVYSAQSLKDVMRLELTQDIWLPAADGFRKADTGEIEAKCASFTDASEALDGLYRRMEAGEAW